MLRCCQWLFRRYALSKFAPDKKVETYLSAVSITIATCMYTYMDAVMPRNYVCDLMYLMWSSGPVRYMPPALRGRGWYSMADWQKTEAKLSVV